jgi:hypothetical protein
MDEEKAVRIVLSLDISQPLIVGPPVRLLPILFEIIALAHVRSRVWDERAKVVHAPVDVLGCLMCFCC